MDNLFVGEQGYLDLMKFVKKHGENRPDRTETGIISYFSPPLLEFDLRDGFPLYTTKKMFFRGIAEETLFFLRGDTDTNKLSKKGINIWKGNTSREFLDSRGLGYLPEGDLGEGYGWQWRNFNRTKCESESHLLANSHDQIAGLIHELKNNKFSRRHIVTAWNPVKLHRMALPPCHMMFQMWVSTNDELHCKVYIRSNDLFLGNPFNVAGYAFITHLIAEACDLEPRRLVVDIGDAHIYENHLEAVEEQLSRLPLPLSKLNIRKEIESVGDIESLDYDDVDLLYYSYHPPIKAPMAI